MGWFAGQLREGAIETSAWRSVGSPVPMWFAGQLREGAIETRLVDDMECPVLHSGSLASYAKARLKRNSTSCG